MIQFTAGQLADMVGGRLVGPPELTVRGVSSLEAAGPEDVAFLRNARGIDAAEQSQAGIVITAVDLTGRSGPVIVCEDAERAMATVLAAVAEERFSLPKGISKLADISPSASIGRSVAVGERAFVGAEAVIGDDAVIYPHAYVGAGCRIGDRTVLCANVSVHDRVCIGADCIIHYNAVIGSEGFGFIQREGSHIKLAQVGTVHIGDRVEIGALTTVDRATLDATVIEDGVKIDNHCHIAHNCHIGPDCILAGYAKLAGSVRLGRGVIVAEDAGINDHVTVGEGAILAASSGVHNNVPAGAVMFGYPARPIAEQRRIFAHLGRLPRMAKKLRELEKQLAELRGDAEQAT